MPARRRSTLFPKPQVPGGHVGAIAVAALSILIPSRHAASGQVLILTADQAVTAADVRIEDDSSVTPLRQDGSAGEAIAGGDVMLIRFEVRPRWVRPRAWLCYRDGQRISGDTLAIRPGRVRLQTPGRPDREASPDALAALFFRTARPGFEPPPDGARIISANGDALDAPTVELTDAGVIVDVDPDADPVMLPRERIAGVIWATDEPSQPEHSHVVELRNGERYVGRLTVLDANVLTLATADGPQKLPRRELVEITFNTGSIERVAPAVELPAIADERPRWRRDLNGVGNPLRIGPRVYRHGLGARGPAMIDLPVPAGARWFVLDVGPDADAPATSAMTFELRIDGESRWRLDGARAGDPPQRVTLNVHATRTISLHLQPDSDDPTGCLGDFANATFIK